eukprot:SAG11_NODE_4443_length_1893_cov_1.060758_1_plen_59_part_00
MQRWAMETSKAGNHTHDTQIGGNFKHGGELRAAHIENTASVDVVRDDVNIVLHKEANL